MTDIAVRRSLTCTVALGVLFLSGGAEAMDRFSAPTGQLGANLTFDPAQRFRLHTEMSYFTQGGAVTAHALGWTFGAGIKVTDQVEIEVGVPVAGVVASGAGTGDRFGVGNLALGANFFDTFTDQLRLKVGGLVAFGPWNESNGNPTAEGLAVAIVGLATNGYQDAWLYAPGYVHIVAPARVEFGTTVQATGDASLHVAVPVSGDDGELFVNLTPGVAFWATPQFALGARMPFQFMTATDAAQLSLEPFLRLEIGEQAFVSTRFTMHLDNELGFSFEDGRFWGLHLAFGGSF